MRQVRESTTNAFQVTAAADTALIDPAPPVAQDAAVAEASARLRAALIEASPDATFAAVEDALGFAIAAHEGMLRRSGEPYVVHPIEVAIILSRMRLDPDLIV